MNISNSPKIPSYVTYTHTQNANVSVPEHPQQKTVDNKTNQPIEIIPKNDVETLRAKLKAGHELTPSDLDYLKSNDPNLYNKALEIAEEREAYKASLKKAQTKNETIQLHDQAIYRILNGSKTRSSDDTLMHVNAINDTHKQFVQSDKYATLKWTSN